MDPDWIPILRSKLAQPTYDPSKPSEQLARELAVFSGKLEIVTWLETIVKNQEANKHGSQ
jgi:hypothetical protein